MVALKHGAVRLQKEKARIQPSPIGQGGSCSEAAIRVKPGIHPNFDGQTIHNETPYQFWLRTLPQTKTPQHEQTNPQDEAHGLSTLSVSPNPDNQRHNDRSADQKKQE